MYPSAVRLNKVLKQHLVPFRADKLDIPDRMVQNDEHARKVIEHREHRLKVLVRMIFLDKCVIEQRFCDLDSSVRRQVMHADVEKAVFKRHGPFQRYRCAGAFAGFIYLQTGVDAVVVRDRNDRFQSDVGHLL